MQNKPNLGNDKMNINSFITSKYDNLFADSGQKTKPIQTQFNPKQSQFNPISKPNKPNSNPILKIRMLCDVNWYSQPYTIEIIPTAIESRQKSTNPPATIVVIIASTLRRSNMIPIIPTIAEAKTEKITSGPTRATKGLPHPG